MNKLGNWDWYIHTIIYKIDNENLLYSTGNFTQFSVIAYMGKEFIKKKRVDICICTSDHFVVHLKLRQHCKSTILLNNFFLKAHRQDENK